MVAAAAWLALAGCIGADPGVDELAGAGEAGGKADAFTLEISDEMTAEHISAGVTGLEVSGELAQLLFDVLASSDLYDEERVGGVDVVRAPLIDCAANGVEAACAGTVFAASGGAVEAIFYTPTDIRPNAQGSIAAAMEMSPEVEVVDELGSLQIGRLRCLVADPPLLGVPDICFVTHPATSAISQPARVRRASPADQTAPAAAKAGRA